MNQTVRIYGIYVQSSCAFSLDPAYKLEFSAGLQNIFNSYQGDFDLGATLDANCIYGPSRPRTFLVGLKLGADL